MFSEPMIFNNQPPDTTVAMSGLLDQHGKQIPSTLNKGTQANSLKKLATKWGGVAGKVITVGQIAMHTIMIVEQLRKNVAIKSQNISMTEFGHETGQRFDQYN